MSFTVIVNLVAFLRNSHHRIHLVDLQLTVNDGERHLIEVRIRIYEVIGYNTHVVGTGCGLRHCPGCCRCRGHRGCHIVQCSVRRHALVSRDGVSFTVIVNLIALLRNGNHCVNLINSLMTVSNVEGHRAEVRVSIFELISSQTHVSSSGIRSCCCCRTAEREVVINIIQSAVDRSCIARHSMLFTIIVRGVNSTLDCHRHINGFNRLITVGHLEGHIREVVVSVGELLGSQTHISGTRFCSSGNGIARENEVGIVVGHIIN